MGVCGTRCWVRVRVLNTLAERVVRFLRKRSRCLVHSATPHAHGKSTGTHLSLICNRSEKKPPNLGAGRELRSRLG